MNRSDRKLLNKQLKGIYKSQSYVLKNIIKKLTKIIELEKVRHQQPLDIQMKIERKIEKLAKDTEEKQKLSEQIERRTERIKQMYTSL